MNEFSQAWRTIDLEVEHAFLVIKRIIPSGCSQHPVRLMPGRRCDRRRDPRDGDVPPELKIQAPIPQELRARSKERFFD